MEKEDVVDNSRLYTCLDTPESSAVILMCWRKGPVGRILRVWEVFFKAIGKEPLEATFFFLV